MASKSTAQKLDDFSAQSSRLDIDIVRGLQEASIRTADIKWPDRRYYDDPTRFFLEILSLRPWSLQIEIMEAVRDFERVAVSSCHKIGKSLTEACLAFWWWAALPDSRVVMSATTAYQIKNVVWREVRTRARWASRGVCYHCRMLEQERISRRGFDDGRGIVCPHGTPITEEVHLDPAHGLLALDMRQIVGFTGRDAEAVAGVSSPNLLYLLDEASGIPDEIYAAIEGNRAGGAKVVLMGNPTRNDGEFYEAFHTKDYKRIMVSAYDCPNVKAGWRAVPGTMTRGWLEQKKEDWGEDSPEFIVRALGKFAVGEAGKTMSLALVTEAVDRWYETPFEGRLFIGVDVAGPGLQGDETCFAVRRGFKINNVNAHRGLTEDGILANLLGLISDNQQPGDVVPMVIVDAEGDVGTDVYRALRSYSEENPKAFQLKGLKASQKAVKRPTVYDTIRDDMWANFVRWIKAGGAIPDDDKLRKEMHLPVWVQAPNSAKLKLEPKESLRKKLKRSPDRAEACELCCWEPSNMDDEEPGQVQPMAQPPKAVTVHEENDETIEAMDPYGGMDAWSR